jgi:tetratricopeptide (TPR) repeat protein
LAIREKAFGPDRPEVAESLNNLAEVYRNQGRYGDAEPLYQRSLAILEQAVGRDHPDVGRVLDNLALAYHQQERYAEIEPFYKRSLAIYEKAYGPDHPRVASALNNLAKLYNRQGRYAEAEPLYRRSLAIYDGTLGPDHLNVAKLLNDLAELYDVQGRYSEAESLYMRSLVIYEKASGPDNQQSADALNNLGGVYFREGRYAEAESLYRRSLTIHERVSGRNSRQVAGALTDLAELYARQGRYNDAEPLYQRSLATYESLADRQGASTTLINLVKLYRQTGREAEIRSIEARWQVAELSGNRPPPPAREPSRDNDPFPVTEATRKRTIEAANNPPIPLFPWPPPTASAKHILPGELFKERATVGEVVSTINSALESQGYVERSFFATPGGGLALVTRLERINEDGSHADERERWPPNAKDQLYGSSLDLIQLLRGLFFADPGRYRVIVFILQNTPFTQSKNRVSEEDARAWLHSGFNTLPPELKPRRFEQGDCTALIYEFVGTNAGVHTVESRLTGQQHLRMAGLRVLFGEDK